MEDGGQNERARNGSVTEPPPPPDPSAAEVVAPLQEPKSDVPLLLVSEAWDVHTVSALAALRMLVDALQSLANVTGDVPLAPPVNPSTTPRSVENDEPCCALSSKLDRFSPTIGSPEIHPNEPIHGTGVDMEDMSLQHAAIARRFFSKTAPTFTLSDYLLRFHNLCPQSSGVYLAAAAYIYRMCVSDLLVPATTKTIHRLSLAAIGVSAKALEDNKWPQERIARIGGISKTQLLNLEVALCYLLDFDLWVDCDLLASRMYLLQQAARQGLGVRSKLSSGFHMPLAERPRTSLETRFDPVVV